MPDALLRTKCTPPALRPALVARPRLAARLRGALAHPLTLVCAPPGFGKTTATLAAGLTLRDEGAAALAWLSLEPLDNDPARFWRYLVAALQRAAPDVGAPLAAAMASPQPPPVEPLLTNLLNDLAARPGQLLLVLDDYHLIEAPAIHAGIELLVERAPPSLHLALLARADPPLPLARLRARGQLLELRAEALRFEPDEAAAMLSGPLGLSLSVAELAILVAQAEGWAAGLQLAGLALQGTPAGMARQGLIERLAQSNRYLIDYLAEEVLDQQPAPLQAFLLQTAVLDQLCGPLCDAVTTTAGGHAQLEELARRGLFLMASADPLHPAGAMAWFRYHQLFRDLLRGHLRRRQPELEPLLHRRAAAWYEASGAAEPAIEHALTGADFDLAARLLDRHASELVMAGRAVAVEGWLERLPAPWRDVPPRANLACAWAMLLRGRHAEMPPVIARAAAAILAADLALSAELHALRAGLAASQGQAGAALGEARLALADLPAEHHFAQAVAHFSLAGARREAGDIDGAISAYEQAIPRCRTAHLAVPELLARAHLGALYAIQGRLRRAEAATRPALAAPAGLPVAGAAMAALGDVLLEQGRLDEAATLLDQAVTMARQSAMPTVEARVLIMLARLRRLQGDTAAAQAALDAAATHVPHAVPAWVEPLLLAERAQLWLSQGAAAAAERLLADYGPGPDSAAGHVREALPLARLRLLLHQGRPAQALALADDIVLLAAAGERQGRLIEALLLRALARAALEDPLAADDLGCALDLAEPEGFVTLFSELGPQLAPLAAAALGAWVGQPAHHERVAYLRRLLAPDEPAAEINAALVEPLTERELEVLRLMARGLTYQQIADELILSINTVRHHVKGLYGKLQSDTRTRAIEQARTLGLL